MGIDATVFLAFVEGLLRNDEKAAKTLDKVWASSQAKHRATDPTKRASDIEAFLKATGVA